VTEEGKIEFALHSPASRSNSIMILIGIAIIAFTLGLELKLVPVLSVTFFGAALIIIGSLFLIISRRNKPKLTPEAKSLLKELNRR
jgi:hypothetical protein